jgi:transporter family protein
MFVHDAKSESVNRLRDKTKIIEYLLTSMQWLYWSLLSAAFAAATAVLAKVGVTGIDSNLATAIRTSVILVFTWAIAFSTAGAVSLENLPGRSWLFLVLSGIATGLSWLCYFRALQLGPASRVAPIDKLSVVFVLLLAAGFLGERLTLAKLGGGALIAAGAIILAVAP